MAEPPSLPYARDEGSTSHGAAYQYYPSYTDTFDEEEEEELNGPIPEEGEARETQYWAANRHRSGKSETEKEEEHSALITGKFGLKTDEKCHGD